MRLRTYSAAVCSVFISLFAGPAQAMSTGPWVFGAWLESQRHSHEDTRHTLTLAGLTGGITILPGVVVEAGVGGGVNDDTDQGLTLSSDRVLSASLRMTAPPSPQGFGMMARAGVTVVDLQQSGANNVSETFSGGHFSLGVNHVFRPNWSWALEWVYTDLDSTVESASLRFSLGWELLP